MKAQTARYNKSELRIINNKIRRERQLKAHIVVFILSIIVFFSILLIVGNTKSMASNRPENELYKYYTNVKVNPGESLYDIADRFIDNNKLTLDRFVQEVVYINSLESPDKIYSGSYLIVPYYDVYHG